MVVLERQFEENAAARRIIRRLGVPDALLDAAEKHNTGIEWRRLAQALDGVFMVHGGGMGQFSFLHSRTSLLQGRTPVEMLSEKNGPDHVYRAACVFAASRRLDLPTL